MKKFLLSAAAIATAFTAMPALAQDYAPDDAYPYAEQDAAEGYGPEQPYDEEAPVYRGGDTGNGSYRGYEPAPVASYEPGYAGAPRRVRPGDYVDPETARYGTGAYPVRRCRGTTGAIIGGIAGALIGAGDGDRGRGRYRYRRGGSTAGALIGGGVGALIGSEIDKSSCRSSR